MKHIYYTDVQGLDASLLGLEDTSGMTVKLISDDSILIEICPGGRTPCHSHNDKERIVVMEGTGEIKVNTENRAIQPWDFVELNNNEQHQIINNSNELLTLMCFRNQK